MTDEGSSPSVVLVTGAAGTIGSEICRQLIRQAAPHRPRQIVMLDIAETPLFYLAEEIEPRAKANGVEVRPVIGTVRDPDFIEGLIKRYAPDAVIHAAALKHVGACERDVCEAVLTNVMGTGIVLGAAMTHGASFVLVSTDKEVAPVSVMGATKRVAELDVLPYSRGRVVRLVNVRGSQGSLIPLIERQIAAGGPVSLTDERMTRYFMDVEDAAQLAIDAMTMPPKRVYAPLLGPPVRIAETIRDFVRLKALQSGKPPVEVVTIGARPGEKLEERLFGPDEFGGYSESGKAMIAEPRRLPGDEWFQRLGDLAEAAVDRLDHTRELLFSLANRRIWPASC
jgi:FlaA1/EpsC-like NDP-sugar epimerase